MGVLEDAIFICSLEHKTLKRLVSHGSQSGLLLSLLHTADSHPVHLRPAFPRHLAVCRPGR